VREPEVWRLVQKVKNVAQLETLIELQDAVGGALKGLDLNACSRRSRPSVARRQTTPSVRSGPWSSRRS
jgi:hypothetical protein